MTEDAKGTIRKPKMTCTTITESKKDQKIVLISSSATLTKVPKSFNREEKNLGKK